VINLVMIEHYWRHLMITSRIGEGQNHKL